MIKRNVLLGGRKFESFHSSQSLKEFVKNFCASKQSHNNKTRKQQRWTKNS